MTPERMNDLPHNSEAERTVLGAILVNNKAFDSAAEILVESDFYLAAHRYAWQAIAALIDRSSPVDLVTLKTELDRTGDLESVGGPAFLAGLIDGVPSIESVAAWCRLIREARALRTLFLYGGQIQKEVHAGGDPKEILERAEAALSVRADAREGAPVHLSSLAKAAYSDIERREKHQGMVGIASGFPDLDRMTGGWQPGDLIVLAARPSMGKTALALQLAKKASTLFVSLEMPSIKIVRRLIAAEARVSHSRIGYGLSSVEWERLAESWNTVTKMPMWIDDQSNIRTEAILRRARRLPVELLIVDYLQLVEGSKGSENRQQEISSISRGLKQIAKALGIPVIALSQLSREVEKRKDRRPMLSDLRESGAIEQDADVVMFLYRAAVYGKTEENEYKAELAVAKQRDGPTGTVYLRFQPEYTLFSPPSEEAL